MVKKKDKPSKGVFQQVMAKGSLYSFFFFFFFMMCTVPIFLLFLFSLFSRNLPGVVLAMVFTAVLYNNFRVRSLFQTVRDLTILNLTMWFLLGFLTVIKNNVGTGSFWVYLLLIPYVVISGFLVYYLLSKTSEDKETIIHGAVAISTMIAIVSAIKTPVTAAFRLMSEAGIPPFLSNNFPALSTIVDYFSWQGEHSHFSFLALLIIFNLPFIWNFLKLKKKNRDLLYLYVIPVLTYVVLQGIWYILKAALPAL